MDVMDVVRKGSIVGIGPGVTNGGGRGRGGGGASRTQSHAAYTVGQLALK